ncbi:MAG: hypothetical protein JSV56_08140 [Methanomassiliicoccales archaeon]|nr:MAG: hypothetical protein JSV56_08140 [Methanomassiliicoccales archaeon]
MEGLEMKNYYDIITNCNHCRSILDAMSREVDKIMEEMQSDDKDFEKRFEPIKSQGIKEYQKMMNKALDRLYNWKYSGNVSIIKIRNQLNMTDRIFYDHLNNHLLHFNILTKAKRGEVTVGENLIPYGMTIRAIEHLKRIPPNKILWDNGVGFFFQLHLPEDQILKRITKRIKESLKSALLDKDLKEGYDIPNYLLVINIAEIFSLDK